ncbi:transcriptional repressor LexA [Pseudothermotoga thermarum]|uniref:LexA repressor n=1 Tax=Pseudothermotoga thermarum DSM 5069 TaxID=688269 RepID=F7YV02_9THEM|nr:transcriptional repressor LexA [Pseudothermotoga thermarum]AEH50286.1 transcriptional repressor, LexA family [Pseudothermotoga thermarum DSM 5069]
MSKELTERQKEVLEFIENYINKHGYPPSIRDIAKAFRITPRGAMLHVVALEKKGYITRSKKARAIKIKYRTEAIRLPIAGEIVAGNVIENIEDSTETVDVPLNMAKSIFEYFVLKARDESMMSEHIVNGDYLILRKQYTVNNGDIAVVLLNNTQRMLRKVYIKDGKLVLMPINSHMQPMELPADKVEILGKVVGVIRIYGQ